MKHRLGAPTTRRGRWAAAVAGLAVIAAATIGGVAASAGTSDPTRHASSDGIWACVSRDGHSRLLDGAVHRGTPTSSSCPTGYSLFIFDTAAPGRDGTDATMNVTAATNVTAWPESSGWAIDSFTRTLTVTRQAAAESAKCGGTPQCFFYTATLTDNGSFVTAIGHPSPNPSKNATIANAVQGSMSGVARAEFYASTDTPDASLLPAGATADPKPASTSDWYQLAFADDTTFAGGKLTAYSWDYSTACEHWHDSINPGDDGAGAADGDVTGKACS